MKRIMMLCLLSKMSYGMFEPIVGGGDGASSSATEAPVTADELKIAHAIPSLQYLAAKAVHTSFYGKDAQGNSHFVPARREEAERVLPDQLMKSSRRNPIPFVDYVACASKSIKNAAVADDLHALAMVMNKKEGWRENRWLLREALCYNKPDIVRWFFQQAPDLTPEDLEKKTGLLRGNEESAMPSTMRVFLEAYADSISNKSDDPEREKKEIVRQRAKELLAVMDTGEPVYSSRCVRYLKTGELGSKDMHWAKWSLFMHTLVHGTQKEADKFLADHPESLEAFSGHGGSPLYAVADKGRADLVAYLLDKGADKEAKWGYKNLSTPLLNACCQRGGDARTLLARGARVDAFDGATPLWYACLSENVDAVMALLEHGANPNVQTGDGATPLHQAAEENRSDIVQLLLAYGANPCIEDKDGKLACGGLLCRDEEIKFLLKRAEDIWRGQCILKLLGAGNVGAGSADGGQ